MAEIAGVTFIFTDYDPGPSDPRVMFIPNTVDDATVSDLIDTFAARQADIDNLIFDPMMSAGGTEALGGGTEVAKTLTNLNLQVAFQPVRVWTATGTATTGDATGVTLTDTGADFVTAQVAPGASVVNFRTGGIGTVLRVVDLNNLLMLNALGGGTDDEWQIGDTYRVINTRQVNISGGNDVAVDNLDAELAPVLPTVFTQVIRTASSSATTANLAALEFSSYNNGVTIDAVNGVSETEFPAGTPGSPVKTIADVLAVIADHPSLKRVLVVGDLTLTTGDDVSNLIFIGESRAKTTITIDPGADVLGCDFSDATITGTLDGGSYLKNCLVGDLDYVDGIIEDCQLADSIITLAGGGTDAAFINCSAYVPGVGVASPRIDMGGSGSDLAMRSYQGGIRIFNMNDANSRVSIDMPSGQVTLESTCLAGSIVLRGLGRIVNSGSIVAPDLDTNYFAQWTDVDRINDRVAEMWRAFGLDPGDLPSPIGTVPAIVEIWQLLGLDAAEPAATDAPGDKTITVGDITIDITTVGDVVTLTRRP